MLMWVLAVLAALLLLVCLTRVGARIVLTDGTFTVDGMVGPLRFRVYPRRERKKQKQEKQSAEQRARGKRSLPKPAWADVKDGARTLWTPLKRALARTRRGVRLDPLGLSLTLGGQKEPADAAQLYGELHGGMWTVMPLLETLMNIPDPELHVGIDFDRETVVLEGEVGVTARIGTLLCIGLGVGFPALRWFLGYQKRKRTGNETSAASAAQERTE